MRGVHGSQEKRRSIQISQMMQRRQLLRVLSSLGFVVPTFYFPVSAQSTTVEVWKDPNCGCCQSWVDHLEANGFKVEVRKNAQEKPFLGTISFLDNQVDSRTGTITMRAEFPNQDASIWPGEFFEVTVFS